MTQYDRFGHSVEMDGDYASIGAYGKNHSSGAAYIYSDYTVPVTSIDEKNGNITRDFYLAQNYPNPFNQQTVIEYDLPQAAFISLQIYDLQGRLIQTLVNGRQQSGRHAVRWDGFNERGQAVASSIYFYRLVQKSGQGQSAGGPVIGRMILLR